MLKWLGNLVDSNEKQLKKLQPIVEQINQLEPEFEKLSDAELRARTDEFRVRLKDGETLDQLLPEAYAAVREAAKRTIGQRHFDVQLMGGIVLHQGKIAEMKTGEGKTLVATLPLYLNALTGEGCHLVTVNDYLSRRDPYWMGPIYHRLGLTVASIYPQQTPDEHQPSRLYDPEYDSGDSRWRHFRPVPRKEAYEADITYGTSSEFGFDYLRDNMVVEMSQRVQRPLHYAIVDEVDNLLIDEARTPLIISGPAEESGQLYVAVNNVVSRMKVKLLSHEPATNEEKEEENKIEEQYDYIAYEKNRNVKETARGQEKLARALGIKVDDLFGGEGGEEHRQYTFEEAKKLNDILSIFRKSMAAHALYQRDRHYVVKDGEVIIVDEFTGRLMFGRRYAEGLHQAIEAKEKVKVQRETMTYATITIQNYFRMYQKLAGMTGTAATEAEEFHKIYGLEVVVVPTHMPMIRDDFPDQIYKNERGKFNAVVREIEQMHREGRPVLLGTVSIEKSEYLSDLLNRKGIPHEVLNAKQHEREAYIIARAGEPAAVTVATNMAGRGVDIVLGGSLDGQGEAEWQQKHNQVVSAGGLHVIGTERHEARRIDNQLRGRSGRQGDPGSSRFYVSLEDDVVRRFGGERIKGIMDWVGMDESVPIENKLVNRSIESAQVRVEGFHFDIRKHLVEYDDVVNKHRELIYAERRKILDGTDLKANILTMVQDEIRNMVASHIADEHGVDWDVEGLLADVATVFPLPPSLTAGSILEMKPRQIEEKLVGLAETIYQKREKELGAENMRVLERLVMLRIIDRLWVEHLTAMEDMRQQAQWQTLRQTRAVDAYKREGYQQFQTLLDTIQHDVVHTIYHVSIVKKEPSAQAPSPMAQVVGRGSTGKKQKAKVGGRKIGRNEPCPCGSGKKYKHCCGR
ncbi:MAG TPA: preprotein translocase subunit SecA [Dehalococcoidia bacterium]|nr:preprotein translocase subunit SecA [Dehalococcoidia bacterium]